MDIMAKVFCFVIEPVYSGYPVNCPGSLMPGVPVDTHSYCDDTTATTNCPYYRGVLYFRVSTLAGSTCALSASGWGSSLLVCG